MMATLDITETRTVNATTLKVEAGVRYWEDAEVNGVTDDEGALIPFRAGDSWCPVIDVDRGSILDWPQGTTASIHYKVCDEGIYTLYADDGSKLTSKEGYVPSIMTPGGSGYGDYIIMHIEADGQIANWRPDLSDFQDED
jgi:hypothetical protein